MNKKYRVTLTDDERKELEILIRNRSGKAQAVKHACILMSADENGEKNWTDSQICGTYSVGIRTAERIRQRFAEDGFDTAVQGKKREVFKEKELDGKTEVHLIALRCSGPPPGYSEWTMRLPADRMAELKYAEHISHESVRQILKKTN